MSTEAEKLIEKFTAWWDDVESTDDYMGFADEVGAHLDAYRKANTP